MITLKEYAERTGITEDQLLGRSRIVEVCLARQIYWRYLFVEGYSYTGIARMFNRRSHATIISGIKRAEGLLYNKYSLAVMYNEVIKRNEK